MCNSWNHSVSCRCGFGGEGHLGRRTSGNDFSSYSRSFLTLRPTVNVRDGGHYTSYINPNARCPVCGDQVYFYKSPHGGRVFFDQLGYPWTKHPCTDSNLWRTSTQQIKFIGDEINQLALYFIHKWEEDGYFPLICKRTKGYKQISGEFLYENFQNGKKLPSHVWLYLKKPKIIAENALFFIKEINSATGSYELKFCYRQSLNNRTLTETVEAQITNFIRPVLQDQRITFQDFTGCKLKPSIPNTFKIIKIQDKAFPKSNKKPRSKGHQSNDAQILKSQNSVTTTSAPKSYLENNICKFCGEKFLILELKTHKKQCALKTVLCNFCNKPMQQHILLIHQKSHCRLRNQISLC